MANYIGFVLTNAGRNLLARAVANETKINFTKLEIGNGYNSGDDKLLTQLVNKKNEYRLNTLKKNNNQVDLTFVITNRKEDGTSAIDTAYKISELGVFAKDDAGTEILYAYNKGTDGDYIPAYSGNNLVEIENKISIVVDEAATVTGIIDGSLTYLTKEEAANTYVKITQEATEITSGISSFEEIRENTGMPNRGVLTLTKIITYKELWELPHGNYAINSEATLKFLGISGLYAAGILKVYKPNMATSEFLKMFVYISQTVEVPGALTGKATLTVFKNAAEQYADVPVTNNIAVWNEKWKKELSITSEEIKVGNTGFMKLANGIILQWGGDMKSSINGNDFRYFPIAFPQGCASATASYSSLESAGQGVSFQAVDRTKFLLGHRMGDGTLTQGMVYWTAIGY